MARFATGALVVLLAVLACVEAQYSGSGDYFDDDESPTLDDVRVTLDPVIGVPSVVPDQDFDICERYPRGESRIA